MKRILGLAALLGHALGAATGIQVYGGARGGRGKRPVKNPFTYKGMAPEYARYWHDATDEAQRQVIQAANAKRQRRAEKLTADTRTSYLMNDVGSLFVGPFSTGQKPNALNPFYVAK